MLLRKFPIFPWASLVLSMNGIGVANSTEPITNASPVPTPLILNPLTEYGPPKRYAITSGMLSPCTRPPARAINDNDDFFAIGIYCFIEPESFP